MFAFKREKNKLYREVLIEKKGNLHRLEQYFIEDYDTVVLVLSNGEMLEKGVLFRYGGYRTNDKGKTSGYFNVELFIGNKHKNFDDLKYIKRFNSEIKEQLFLRLFPSRCVLIEKNIIKKHEDIQEQIRQEWRKNPIFGGG